MVSGIGDGHGRQRRAGHRVGQRRRRGARRPRPPQPGRARAAAMFPSAPRRNGRRRRKRIFGSKGGEWRRGRSGQRRHWIDERQLERDPDRERRARADRAIPEPAATAARRPRPIPSVRPATSQASRKPPPDMQARRDQRQGRRGRRRTLYYGHGKRGRHGKRLRRHGNRHFQRHGGPIREGRRWESPMVLGTSGTSQAGAAATGGTSLAESVSAQAKSSVNCQCIDAVSSRGGPHDFAVRHDHAFPARRPSLT